MITKKLISERDNFDRHYFRIRDENIILKLDLAIELARKNFSLTVGIRRISLNIKLSFERSKTRLLGKKFVAENSFNFFLMIPGFTIINISWIIRVYNFARLLKIRNKVLMIILETIEGLKNYNNL